MTRDKPLLTETVNRDNLNVETMVECLQPRMLAYYAHDLSPFLIRFSENFGLRWYGLAYWRHFFCPYRSETFAAWLRYSQAQSFDFIIGGGIFGVLLGGRLGYMLFYDLQNFLQSAGVMDGGMSAHGGMIGLTLYTLWYSLAQGFGATSATTLRWRRPSASFSDAWQTYQWRVTAGFQRALGHAVSKELMRHLGDRATCPERSGHD
jgi:hypothetical protein